MNPPGADSDGDAGILARIHSVETLGIGDGPGVRFIIHFQGCPLRCPDCPDPDCRGLTGGRHVGTGALVAEVRKFAAYMDISGGGVTVAGGEPLNQMPAVADLFRRCRAGGIRTALDTSGAGNLFAARGLLHLTDLLILDITTFDTDGLTAQPPPPGIRFARHAGSVGTPMWLRLTLVPGVTDDPERLAALAGFAATLPMVEKVEVVPCDRRGGRALSGRCPFPARHTAPQPTPDQLRAARTVFRRHGLRAE